MSASPIERNTVHCLVGENGAGKSTLVKMLTGALQPTSGTMTVRGVPYQPSDPHAARAGGIATLFQELHVVDQLTRAGEPDARDGADPLRVPDPLRARRSRGPDARGHRALHRSVGQGLHPERRAEADRGDRSRGVVRGQRHHHGRADGGAVRARGRAPLRRHPATARVGRDRGLHLAQARRDLRARRCRHGAAGRQAHRHQAAQRRGGALGADRDDDRPHRVPWLRAPRCATDADTVLTADGPHATTCSGTCHSTSSVARWSASTALSAPARRRSPGPSSGPTSSPRARSRFKGRRVGRAPRDAIAAGIALVPEERRTQGLFTRLTIRRNIPVMNMRRLSRRGSSARRTSGRWRSSTCRSCRIATDSIDKTVDKLSGGNQQKVVLVEVPVRRRRPAAA